MSPLMPWVTLETPLVPFIPNAIPAAPG